MTADNASVTITATNGSQTLTAIYSLSKAKAGADGVSPIIYRLVPSANSIKRSNSGVYTPTSITIGAESVQSNTVTSLSLTSTTDYKVYYSYDNST